MNILQNVKNNTWTNIHKSETIQFEHFNICHTAIYQSTSSLFWFICCSSSFMTIWKPLTVTCIKVQPIQNCKGFLGVTMLKRQKLIRKDTSHLFENEDEALLRLEFRWTIIWLFINIYNAHLSVGHPATGLNLKS